MGRDALVLGQPTGQLSPHERSLRAMVKGFARIGPVTVEVVYLAGLFVEHWPPADSNMNGDSGQPITVNGRRGHLARRLAGENSGAAPNP